MSTGGAVVGLWPQLGAIALVLVICWWISRRVLKGDLVARQTLLDVQADRDYWRTSADTWQKVSTEHGMTLEKHTATLERLLTYAETTQHVVTEIQRAGAGGEP